MQIAAAPYTVGHTTRATPELVELLRVGSVDMVVDIRKTPRSRTDPTCHQCSD